MYKIQFLRINTEYVSRKLEKILIVLNCYNNKIVLNFEFNKRLFRPKHLYFSRIWSFWQNLSKHYF